MTSWNKFIRKQNKIQTVGLVNRYGWELSLVVGKHDEKAYVEVLEFIVNYLVNSNVALRDEETIVYKSWLVKVKKIETGLMEIWEAAPNGEGFQLGCDHLIKLSQHQTNFCKSYNVEPLFPGFGQKVVYSKGIYEGLPIEAVRYPSPNHMTGWYLTTEMYDNNTENLMLDHFFHFAFGRPELLGLLSLPSGFRFFYSKEESEVWFDQAVLEE